MQLHPYLAALLLVLLSLYLPPAAASDAVPAKRYTINLDLPPEDRWTQVARDHAANIVTLTKIIHEMLPPEIVEMVSKYASDPVKVFPYPYGQELAGIGKVTGVSNVDIVLSTLIYSLTAYNQTHTRINSKACTSIVSVAENGSIYHGRNLDYGIGVPGMTELLQNMTIMADFQDNGETLYTGTLFAGMVGLATGQKPNKFTISFNERDAGELWMNALEAFVAGTHAVVVFAIRDVLANREMDYRTAVERLTTTPLIAPCYFIIGGVNPYEGVVVTRGRERAIDTQWLGFNNSWFLVETNYDHWEPPPREDNRRDPAIKAMDSMGRKNVGEAGLFGVLSTYPVLREATTYTTIMSAASPGLYQSWVRHYHDTNGK